MAALCSVAPHDVPSCSLVGAPAEVLLRAALFPLHETGRRERPRLLPPQRSSVRNTTFSPCPIDGWACSSLPPHLVGAPLAKGTRFCFAFSSMTDQPNTGCQRPPHPQVDPGGNWSDFDWCNQFLQTAQELATATTDLVLRAASQVASLPAPSGHLAPFPLIRQRRPDFTVTSFSSPSLQNIMYLELRLCPALHCKEGLTVDQVLEAVIFGFSEGIEQSGDRLEGGIIVCIMRSMPLRHAREMIDLAERFLDRGAIGAGEKQAPHCGLRPALHKPPCNLIDNARVSRRTDLNSRLASWVGRSGPVRGGDGLPAPAVRGCEHPFHFLESTAAFLAHIRADRAQHSA